MAGSPRCQSQRTAAPIPRATAGTNATASVPRRRRSPPRTSSLCASCSRKRISRSSRCVLRRGRPGTPLPGSSPCTPARRLRRRCSPPRVAGSARIRRPRPPARRCLRVEGARQASTTRGETRSSLPRRGGARRPRSHTPERGRDSEGFRFRTIDPTALHARNRPTLARSSGR